MAFPVLAQADQITEIGKIMGWTMALGLVELVLWSLGLGLLFLLTIAIPGMLWRALVRAPLLLGLAVLMVPRYTKTPWTLRDILVGLLVAGVAAWFIEWKWKNDDDDADLDLYD